MHHVLTVRAPTLRLHTQPWSSSSILHRGFLPAVSRRAHTEVRRHPRTCTLLSLSLSWVALFFNNSRRRLPVGKDLSWNHFCCQEPPHRVCDLVTKSCTPELQPEIKLASAPSMAIGLLEVSSKKLIPSSHP
ncbi:hypothetical protein BDA96_06G037900 [Sorghum bicolor]|uniref:Uncharacterized protein n=2 Tax=Sorghum bicolor TaxID=4558 RepID=A0A921QNW8_SORBI|nr:hypothetical protein BDA96_06G037900 [Sorghum bicolor]OQU81264.1 hypothetical protein SORBI_3006G034650 [Sorghum bicolor]